MNYMSQQEVRDTADLMLMLNEVFDRLRTRGSKVDFDHVQVFDSNGEAVAVLEYETGGFVIRAEGAAA